MSFSQDNVIAYFQPILSADSNKIYSYEVLGRFVDSDGAVKSLGHFFHDSKTTDEDALKVDRMVRRYAMKKYAEEKRTEYLFLNIRLAWLEKFAAKPEELPTIRYVKEFGTDPSRIVIEITEEEFNASSDAYIDVLTYYRNAGFRIALDDYGKEASNIDRIAQINPDIIKIDIDYIRKIEDSYHYREYLRFLTAFAESVGIEVLYEGIETQRQLDICISSKGRFYQGFLIARPQESMKNAFVNHLIFSASIEKVYEELHEKIEYIDTLRASLDSKIGCFLLDNPLFYEKKDIEAYFAKLCSELPEVLRIYLCDRYGYQITPNFEWNSGKLASYDYCGKNWAWRGFFHEALEAFISGKSSCLSTVYRDFATKKRVFIYFYALSDDVFLFAEINNPSVSD